MIEVEGLVKRYKGRVAVDGVSLHADAGSVFAFLGSNGAGKTTTISCITTALPFDAGQIRVAGHDVRTAGDAVRRSIGVVFQSSILDPVLTARENLRFRATLSGLSAGDIPGRVAELARLIELEEFLDRPYGRLSGGQARRVDIARALLARPAVLFLDEPTAGLDPGSRAAIWRTIADLRETQGMTVFLTTHYMEETEEADAVCIIDAGRVIAQGTPAELRAQHSASVLTLTSTDTPALTASLAAYPNISVREDSARLLLQVPNSEAARDILATRSHLIADFEFRHGRMDDVFLALTGRTPDLEEA